MTLFVKQGEKCHLYMLFNNNELRTEIVQENDTMILFSCKKIFLACIIHHLKYRKQKKRSPMELPNDDLYVSML